MVANNSMASTTGTLADQIRELDLRVAERRHRIRGDFVSLQRAVRARIASPLMMLGAFSTGFVLGRTTAGHRSWSAGREQSRHEAGLIERMLVVIAVVRSWIPLLRVVAGWFDRLAKAPLDDTGPDDPVRHPTELHPHYPNSSCNSPIGRQEAQAGTPLRR